MLGALRVMPKVAASTPPVAGYVAWYDASDTSSITSSGGLVSQWNDKSGNSYHLTQSTAANKPTTGATSRNGRNVLDFDGGDWITKTSFPAIAQPLTFFAVAFGTTAGGQVISTKNGALSLTMQTASKLVELFAGAADGIYSTTAWSSWAQVTAIANGNSSSSRVYVNGTLEASGDASHPGTNGMNTQLMLGAYAGDTSFVAGRLNGSIAEIVIYGSALGTTDRQSVESYLRTKWGTP